MCDRRAVNDYKVKKERRLKSFIEVVTKNHLKSLKSVAKEKGMNYRYRHIGEDASSGEEKEWNVLNQIVLERKEKLKELRKKKRADETGRKKELKVAI